MRIFIAVRHSIDPRYFYGGLWSNNFYPALRRLGHDLVESQVDLLPASRFMGVSANFTFQEREVRAKLTQQVIDEVRQAHKQQPLDLFLSYFYNAHFDPAGFDEIHQLGIPTVNFYCNSIHQIELVSEIAAKVNFAWHSEKEARNSYLNVGANPVWVQMGADPKVYHPVFHEERQAKACFIGQRYADRDRYLVELIANNVPIDIYGSGWRAFPNGSRATKMVEAKTEYLGRRLIKPGSMASYAQATWQNLRKQGLVAGLSRTVRQLNYCRQSGQIAPLLESAACGFADSILHTFARYEVVLNFSNVWADGRPGSTLIPHVRLRDFEAPMCRTCYLTGYTDEIAEFYELGQEIETYRTYDELVDKTKFYLAHPTKAEKLRTAGYRRAVRDHTWECRFDQLFQKIGLRN